MTSYLLKAVRIAYNRLNVMSLIFDFCQHHIGRVRHTQCSLVQFAFPVVREILHRSTHPDSDYEGSN